MNVDEPDLPFPLGFVNGFRGLLVEFGYVHDFQVHQGLCEVSGTYLRAKPVREAGRRRGAVMMKTRGDGPSARHPNAQPAALYLNKTVNHSGDPLKQI